MQLPRTLSFALVIAGIAGIVTYRQCGPRPSQPAPDFPSATATSMRVADGSPGRDVVGATTGAWADLNLAVGPSAVSTRLSATAAAVVAEASALQQLVGSAEAQLDATEWTAFAEVSAEFQAVRQAYEATIAAPSVVDHGRYRVEVPMYSDAGDALRTRFYEQLREKLGEGAMSRVVRTMGPALEGYFGGFGVGVQTLEFAADPTGAESEYAVTRTLTYWNEAGERLTSRRETYFPGIEDPSGERWGPFLSVLASHVAAKAKS